MANQTVFLRDLTAGRSSSRLEVRLLRFWEARNVRRGGELMGVDMIFIDSQSTLMPATVNVNRLDTFRPRMKAGSLFTLTRFDVTRCNPNFRLTDSPLMIRFSDSTAFDELTDMVAPIPEERFRFRDHASLNGLANSNTQLPDIIGELTAVKSTVGDGPHVNERVMATVKLDNDVSVTLSLFESQAVSFHQKLEGFGGDPRVVVATNINPKIVGGRLFLNATSATHIFFDKETAAGAILFYELVARNTGNTPVPTLLRGHAKVEPLSISELNEFIITAEPQDIEFVCTGKVTGIKMDKGWCYVSCSRCTKKLERTVSSFTCGSCNNTNAVGVLRYRVEMSIADDTDEGLFVGFDGEMTKLHNMRAYEAGQLAAGDGVNPEDTQPPAFIADMVGKAYSFKVKVSTYNFSANHRSFTISRILSEHEPLPLPNFVVHDGDDDNDDDMPGAISVSPQVKAGVTERGGLSSAGPSNGPPAKKPRAAVNLKVAKKGRKE